MFAEHRALKKLRRLSRVNTITRYASAMYRARLYSRYAIDPKLAMQMLQHYTKLSSTAIGQRILLLGKRRRKA